MNFQDYANLTTSITTNHNVNKRITSTCSEVVKVGHPCMLTVYAYRLLDIYPPSWISLNASRVWKSSSIITKIVPNNATDDFKSMDKNMIFVDKTDFIKRLMESEGTIFQITRPRGFGKSTNLAMLKYFLNNDQNSSMLFYDTEIMKDPVFCKTHQNKYPVIFIPFRDTARVSFAATMGQIKIMLAELYDSFDNLLESMDPLPKSKFLNVMHNCAKEVELENALLDLTKLLKAKFNKKVILLIDDFDEPLYKAFLNGYHSEMVNFLGNLFLNVLENEQILEKAVLTGITSLNPEMGITNIKSDSVMEPIFPQYFGFTEAEVKDVILKSKKNLDLLDFHKRLFGYQVGVFKLYNSLSVVNAVSKGRLPKFWSKNPTDALAKKLVGRVGMAEKVSFDLICANHPVQKWILPNLCYNDALYTNETAFWTFFVHVGYLNAVFSHKSDYLDIYSLSSPNPEVADSFKSNVVSAVPPRFSTEKYLQCVNALKDDDLKMFFNHISSFIGDCGMYQTMRSYDAFVRTILTALYGEYYFEPVLEDHWFVRGFNVTMFPKDLRKDGIFFRFKIGLVEGNLQFFAAKAVAEGACRHTAAVVMSRGYEKVLVVGMAFAERSVGMNFTKIIRVPRTTTLAPTTRPVIFL